ncbi:unnamed protein product [Rotaria socialis]|uniref:peptidyl-tRNA hydrolase n=1 Tax=Rotaria socialis TaxID=392032 RepID=A0A817NBA0_9BILA|nr:unnamed protein product [Rotaria socialis]CAF3232084.1 unnamed protein product [Rotaria socialis]CAF3332038.1 unnamed protein product [Rotaria socialis]CAF3371382.1 unnamed protein product [Rotaria socialis]CAF3435125.1 unnamed protein product [Rotaria socialis]
MAEGGNQTTASSSSMVDGVSKEYLASLIEMGIDEAAARQALTIVHNRSLEEALAIIFGEPLPSASSTTTKEQAVQVSQSNITVDDDIGVNVATYKMLFVVNGSLDMSSGKMASQVAHAAIDLYQKLIEKRSKALFHWQEYGETKIVVRGKSTDELLDILSGAKKNSSITTSVVEDAGRTEIESGSITCVGLFGTNEQLKPITGHLKLMQDCLKCNGK